MWGLGITNTVSAARAVVLGNEVTNNVADSVVLGHGSSVDSAVGTSSVIINGNTYNFAGGVPLSTVSVGAAGNERTITNVAAGRISETSTDVVTGSQLFATNQALEAATTHYVSVKGTDTAAGSNYNNDGAAGLLAIAIGQSARAQGFEAIALGVSAEASKQSDVAIGSRAALGSAMSHGTVYIGRDSGAGAKAFSASPLVFSSVFIGTQAGQRSVGDANVAIGYNAGYFQTGSQNVFLGAYAGEKSATRPGNRNVVIGNQQIFDDKMPSGAGYVNDSVTIGTLAKAQQSQAIAIGSSVQDGVAGATASGLRSIAIGTSSVAANQGATASGQDWVALGTDSKAGGESSLALGKGAVVSHANAVALGSGSVTAPVVKTASVAVNDRTYSFAGATPESTVSVGAPGAERTITNVAAGRINAGSTDAINGSQLHATNRAVGLTHQQVQGQTSALGGGASFTVSDGGVGTWTAPTYNVAGGTYRDVGAALVALGTADGKLKTGFNVAVGAATYAVNLGGSEPQTLNFAAGKNAVVDLSGNKVTYSVADAPVFAGSVTARGFNASNNKMTQLAVGTADTDAVNISQLKGALSAIGGDATVNADGTVKNPSWNIVPSKGAAATAVTNVGEALTRHESRVVSLEGLVDKGITFAAGSGTPVSRKLGEQITITGGAGGNIATTTTPAGEVLINVKSAPVFTGIVKAGGFDASGQKVTSVADGELNDTSTDAVTGRQLFAVDKKALAAQNTATQANTTAEKNKTDIATLKDKYGDTTEAINKGLNIGGDSGSKNVKLGDTVKVAGDGKNISTDMNSTSGILTVTLKPDVTLTSVTAGGIKVSDAGVAMDNKKITGLAAGDLVTGGTEGVNTGQLYDAYSKVAGALGTTLNNGALVNPSYKVGGATYNTVGNALAALNRQAGTVVYVAADGARVYRGTDGQFYKQVDTTGAGIGDAVKEAELRHALVMPDGTVADGRGLSNVGVGKVDTDAVNVSQLKDALDAIGGGAGLNADGSVKKPSWQIREAAGKPATSVDTVGDALNALKRKSGPVVYMNDAGEQVYKATDDKYYTKLNADGSGEGTAVENSTLRHALLMPDEGITGGRGLSNVGAGKADTDAVNVSQLKPVLTALGTALDANGAVTPPSYTIKGNTYNTVGAALTGLTNFMDGGIALKMRGGDTGKVLAIGDALDLSAGKNVNVSFTSDDASSPRNRSYSFAVVDSPDFAGTVKARGFDATSGKIINLAQGTAGTDAVNVAQLNAAIAGNTGTVTQLTLNTPMTYAADVNGTAKYVMLYKDPADSNKLKAYNFEDWDTANNRPKATAVAIGLDKVYVAGMGLDAGTGAQGIQGVPIRMANVAHGRAKTDAVNIEQLEHAVSAIGAGMKIEEGTGKVILPTFKMPGNRVYENVGSVVFALKTGTVGPMVYTAPDGERLVYLKDPAENGTTTYTNAGWYRLGKVAPDGKSLIAGTNPADAQVIADNVRLSLVNAANPQEAGVGGNMILGNLAAGRVDNDAVNVSQLKKLVDIVDDGAKINADGSLTMPTWLIKPSATEAATPVDNINEALMRHEKRITEDEGKLSSLADKPLTVKATAGQSDRKLGDTLTVQGGNANIKTSITSEGVMTIQLADAPVFSGKVSAFGFDAGNQKITNVAAGSEDTDAVNKKQLDTLRADLGTSDSAAVKYDNATTRDTVTLGAGVTPALTDGVKLTNLAAGAVTPTSKDAIRGSQLIDERKTLAGYLGGNSTVEPDGSITKPTYAVDEGTYHTVGDALNALNRKSGTVVYVKEDGTPVYRATDGKYYEHLGDNGVGTGTPIPADKLHHALKTADDKVNSPRRLSNLADGLINATSNDAVSGSQIMTERKALADYLGGGATVDEKTGDLMGPTYRIGTGATVSEKKNVGDALSALNEQAFKPFSVDGDSGTPASVKLGEGFSIKGKSGGNISTASTASGIVITLSDTPKFGSIVINSPAGKITGLTDGAVTAESSDAVTGRQLKALSDKITGDTGTLINTPLTFKTNAGDVTKKLGEILTIRGNSTVTSTAGFDAKNVATEIAGGELVVKFATAPTFDGKVTAASFTTSGTNPITIDGGHISGLLKAEEDSQAVNLGQMNAALKALEDTSGAKDERAVKYDGPKGEKTSVTLGGKDATSGNPNAAVKLTNLAEGSVNENSTDAIRGSQLYETRRRMAAVLGGGATLDANNNFTAPKFGVDGKDYNVIGDAIAALNRRSGTVVYVRADDSSKKVFKSPKDNLYYESLNADGTGVGGPASAIQVDKVRQALLGPDGSTNSPNGSVLVNVGRGAITATSKDAVNGAQLYDAYSNVTSWLGGDAAIGPDGTPTAPTFMVNGTPHNTVADALNALSTQAFKPLTFQGNNDTVLLKRKGGETLQIIGEATTTGDYSGENIQVIGSEASHSLKLLFAEAPVFNGTVTAGGFKVTGGPELTKEGLNMQGKPVTNLAHQAGDNNAATNKSVDTAINKALGSFNPGDYADLKDRAVLYKEGSEKGVIELAGSGGTKISNLKDGEAESDAVNVKQLRVVDTKANNNATAIDTLKKSDELSVKYDNGTKSSITLGKGTGSPVQLKNLASAGDLSVPDNAANAVNVSDLNKALSGLGGNLTDKGLVFGGNEGGDVTRKLGEKLTISGDAKTAGTYSGANLKTVMSSGKVTLQMAESPQFGSVVLNSGGQGTIRGLSNTSWNRQTLSSGQAATEDQLGAVDAKVAANSAVIKDLEKGNATSVKYDNPAKDTLTLAGKDGTKLTNLRDGKVAASSKDAVTGSQLHGAAENLKSLIGGDAKNVNGTVTAGNIGGTGKGTIDEAIKSINSSAGSALQSWTAQVDGKAVRTVDRNNSNINFVTGDNMVLTNEGGAIKIATARRVNFDRVTTGKTELSNEGLKIKGGPSVTDKGIDGGGKPISNVGKGTRPDDVATVGQVSEIASAVGSNWAGAMERLYGMDRRISSVGAMAAAFSGMMPLDFDEMNPTMFSVGFGYYSGQNAVALGLQHYANRDLLFNAGVAWSSDEKMFRMGATWRMGASQKFQTQRVSTTELKALSQVNQLQQTVESQRQEMVSRDAQMAEQQRQLQEQRRLIEALTKRMGQLEEKK